MSATLVRSSALKIIPTSFSSSYPSHLLHHPYLYREIHVTTLRTQDHAQHVPAAIAVAQALVSVHSAAHVLPASLTKGHSVEGPFDPQHHVHAGMGNLIV
jgi:hypothetical protein